MKIIMTKTRYGSEDGFVVRLFLAGREYEMAETLAEYFINRSCARLMPPQDDKGEKNVKQ